MRFTFINNRYDIILDCAKQGPERVRMKGYPYNTYITLNSPMLKNFDQHGLVLGALQNLGDIARFNVPTAQNQGCVKWAFFMADRTGIDFLQEFVKSGKVKYQGLRISKVDLSR